MEAILKAAAKRARKIEAASDEARREKLEVDYSDEHVEHFRRQKKQRRR